MASEGQDSTPYVDALLAYSARDPGRFQVPGHKGGRGADPAMRALVGEIGLRNDIPSITEGVDIGPEPTPSSGPRTSPRRPGARGAAGS